MNCGACDVRTNIPALIVEGYIGDAAYDDTTISREAEAVLTITQYRARSDVLRHLLGWKAGVDRINAVVRYQEREFVIEKKFIKSSTGIEDLARLVGRAAFDQLSRGD